MTYRFYITLASSQVQVYPLNFMKTSLQDTLGNDEIFYRRKFNGTLRFITDDYDLIYMVEQLDPCTELILTIEQKDSGADTYHTYWTGYFMTTDGYFDHDNCYFEVTPKLYDNYKIFDEYGEDEYNIVTLLDAQKVTVRTLIPAEEYNENLFVTDVIEYLLTQIVPGATLTSWFLNNENNPVIGGTNQYRFLTIAQKSDIKRPNATNPATVGMMSFNQMMDILRMYNLYWTFDGSVLRIEHYDYWSSAAGIDLRTQASAVRSNKYSYLKERMPKYEKFSFMEAKDGSYVPHTIHYDGCVDASQKSEFTVNVTTDLSYIMYSVTTAGEEGNISDDGWVILANEYDGTHYNVYYGTTHGSPFATYNYVNSWAYLLRAFFMHGRVLLNGYIQGTAYEFISARKIKQQQIKAVVCYGDDYDPNDYITTKLGETWFAGQKASVKEATLYPDGRVDFNLLYGEDRNSEVVIPPTSKNLHIIIDTTSYTVVISVLSEPNIYDTYYWILWNDGDGTEVCQEIMIPAGTVYQSDLVEELSPVIDVKFNYSHASLDDWTVTYNDNAPMTATVDCPAGEPDPPDVPEPTTMIGASQSSDCAPILVGWNASGGATYYALFRNPGFSLEDDWVLIDSTVNTYTYDSNQCDAAGYTFRYKVQACNIAGCSADSDETNHGVMCM